LLAASTRNARVHSTAAEEMSVAPPAARSEMELNFIVYQTYDFELVSQIQTPWLHFDRGVLE
jgi:hypothetical protein